MPTAVRCSKQDGPNMPMVVTSLTSWAPGHLQATCCCSVPGHSGRLVSLLQPHRQYTPLHCPHKLPERRRCRRQLFRPLVVARSASTDLVKLQPCMTMFDLVTPFRPSLEAYMSVCFHTKTKLQCAVGRTLGGSGHSSPQIPSKTV